MGVSILEEMISYLVGGITGMASGLGEGLNALVTNIFITTSETGATLSTFGAVIVCFAGIALAIGLSRFVVNWLTSFGN